MWSTSLQLLLVTLASRSLAFHSQHIIQPNRYTSKDVLDDEFEAWMVNFQKE